MNHIPTATGAAGAAEAIVIEEVFPASPAAVWRALTTGRLLARWLMEPQGFAPVIGTEFTFRTTPAGAWDGTIRCRVLEVVAERRLAYAWRGGDAGNAGAYGSLLDTTVTWTLTPEAGGTRLMLVHSGFVLPRNAHAHASMSGGWRTLLGRLAAVVAGEASAE